MFNDSNPVDTGGADHTAPATPMLRTIRVRRWSPDTDEMETITLNCHTIGMTQTGGIIFQTWRIDPVVGPIQEATRGFADYIDFEDITSSVQPAALIVQ